MISLVAVCASAAFFTGCGESDSTSGGSSNNNTASGAAANSPSSLNGQTYTLQSSGAAGNTVIAFGQGGGTYTLTQGATAETGTFTAHPNGQAWDIVTVNDAHTMTSTLMLSFTSLGAGNYSFQQPGQAMASGSFVSGSNPGNPPDTTGGNPSDTTGGPPPSTTGEPPPATTGGVPVGTVPAPTLAPAAINVVTGNADSGVGAGATYTVVLNGSTSGTFQITNSGSNGNGTFTYAPDGNQARLILTYGGAYQGDFDDMTLFFTQAHGSIQPNQFIGNQQVNNVGYPFRGTFTY
jgi:hypothetical protein